MAGRPDEMSDVQPTDLWSTSYPNAPKTHQVVYDPEGVVSMFPTPMSITA